MWARFGCRNARRVFPKTACVMISNAYDFHQLRRAFIMMPDGHLLVAPKNTDLSHEQMLNNIGMVGEDVPKFLTTIPRGYFMNGELCVYQGFDMTPGAIWRVPIESYDIVRQFIPKLHREFAITDNTNLYLGVRVGKVGTIWDKLYKTTIGAFMR